MTGVQTCALPISNSLAHILFQAVTIYPWLYTVIIARIQYIEDVRQVRPIKPCLLYTSMIPKMNFTIPNMTSPTMQRAIYPNQATKVCLLYTSYSRTIKIARMENPIKTIQEKVNGMKGRLRGRLDSLPPRVRLKVVLVMFGLFALCSLYMIGSAIINFGNGKTSNIEVEHIESRCV